MHSDSLITTFFPVDGGTIHGANTLSLPERSGRVAYWL